MSRNLVMSHTTSTFNMADVKVLEHNSLMATPTLKSNAGDQNVYKKKNLSWLFGADRKICPSGSLSGITPHSLVMPNSDPRTDFSIRTSLVKDSYNLYRRQIVTFGQ